MAQECGFFNAQLVGEEYDRVYLAEQFAAYFASFIGNGIFGSSMQQLEVMAQNDSNMSVKVLAGQAWINGWWYRNTEEYTLSIDVADGVLSRIDAIVLRWGNSERDMWLHVIKGTPSANPQAPAISRDADYYDLQLATVSVGRGVIRITQAQIQDTRLNNAVCGLVTGVVDQIDTTDLYNQFEQYFREFKENYEAEFETWTEEQRQAYLTYIHNAKVAYDNYIAEMQSDYDTWTSDKQTEWTQWVNDQETLFSNWSSLWRTNYEDWTAQQQQAFVTWYTLNTTQWTSDFQTWFDDIKGQLSGDIAGQLQLEINELKAPLANTQVAEIEHNLNEYIHCDLFEVTGGYGVGPCGEVPCGGGPLSSSQVVYTLVDKNNIIVDARDGLGTVSEVVKLTDRMYAILFENKSVQLIIFLDTRSKEVAN